jgi:hypothetical protein
MQWPPSHEGKTTPSMGKGDQHPSTNHCESTIKSAKF